MTGTVQNVAGNLATSGTVEFQLQPNANSLAYRVTGTAIIAPNSVVATINASGQLKAENGTDPLELWGNDTISPANTFYRAKFFPDGVATQTWNLLLINGASYDLASPQFYEPADFVPNESPPRFQQIESNIIPAYDSQYVLGTDQKYFATAYIRQVFADVWNIVTLSISNLIVSAKLMIPSYAKASLPASSSPTAGSIARVSDDVGGLWLDSGVQWVKVLPYINVKDAPYNVKGDGSNETVAIQAALNAGARVVFFPEGNYGFTSLVIPTAASNFEICGMGPASILIQYGTGITFTTNVSGNVSCFGTIRDLTFNGAQGTGDTINTSYAQILDLDNLMFLNVPTGFSSIKVDGNSGAAVFTHDVRLLNIRIYTPTNHGVAGIRLGSYTVDCLISEFTMNAGGLTDYCILADTGASAIQISDSHPYGAAINNVKLSGSNLYFAFTSNTFDAAGQDLVKCVGAGFNRFSTCFFEAIADGKSALLLDNSSANSVLDCTFAIAGPGPALSCVRETNGSNSNNISSAIVANALANFTTPFDITGSSSNISHTTGVWSNSATYDPPSLGDGVGATTTVSVTGAKLGDSALATFSLDLQGITLTAWVSSANTVSVRFQNESGGTLDLSSGTLRAQITRIG